VFCLTTPYSYLSENLPQRRLLNFLGLADTSVGYCHADTGCKTAIGHMQGNNGIVRSRHNDTFYVANCLRGEIRVLERQSDDSLVLDGVIKTGVCTAVSCRAQQVL
jgi:arylesterase/paraoxonase